MKYAAVVVLGILIGGFSLYCASVPRPVPPSWNSQNELVCPDGLYFYPNQRLCRGIKETPAVVMLTWLIAAGIALPVAFAIYRAGLPLDDEDSN
ncbi:hypothetical protein L6654_41555 [Bradyrhizobium sp. WYCCWR 13023]|uniref:Uncharacterized protein n=1 Tax=Bradyrhizobium zhengyangense TaxID=2911009 RepID=A0A9X1RHZ1_9BRAD|nr:hypothetical protein [Bradyrhizobium zhengyangense]MCG2633049.1 hypothetical protein [Bradyrhizobium zhengyangense]